MASAAASITIDTTVFNFLTSLAKVFHADEVGHMFFGRVGVRFILRGLKIVNIYSTLSALAGKTSLSGLM